VARDPQAVKDRIGYMAPGFGLYSDLSVDEKYGFLRRPVRCHSADRAKLLPESAPHDAHEPFRSGAPACSPAE